jgi:hypothetical protein
MVLVFFKFPKGSTIIDGKRVYGYLEPHDPVRLPWSVYKQHSQDVIQAPYDKKILESMFPGKSFPNLSFTYHEIRFLDWEQMCSLCNAFGFTTNRSNISRRRKLRKFMKEYC